MISPAGSGPRNTSSSSVRSRSTSSRASRALIADGGQRAARPASVQVLALPCSSPTASAQELSPLEKTNRKPGRARSGLRRCCRVLRRRSVRRGPTLHRRVPETIPASPAARMPVPRCRGRQGAARRRRREKGSMPPSSVTARGSRHRRPSRRDRRGTPRYEPAGAPGRRDAGTTIAGRVPSAGAPA